MYLHKRTKERKVSKIKIVSKVCSCGVGHKIRDVREFGEEGKDVNLDHIEKAWFTYGMRS
jgi:hypothetical protein